jgi:hypothetical protein
MMRTQGLSMAGRAELWFAGLTISILFAPVPRLVQAQSAEPNKATLVIRSDHSGGDQPGDLRTIRRTPGTPDI